MNMLQRVASGHSTIKIAEALGVSGYTVTKRINRLCDELGAVDKANLIAIAYERGILAPAWTRAV